MVLLVTSTCCSYQNRHLLHTQKKNFISTSCTALQTLAHTMLCWDSVVIEWQRYTQYVISHSSSAYVNVMLSLLHSTLYQSQSYLQTLPPPIINLTKWVLKSRGNVQELHMEYLAQSGKCWGDFFMSNEGTWQEEEWLFFSCTVSNKKHTMLRITVLCSEPTTAIPLHTIVYYVQTHKGTIEAIIFTVRTSMLSNTPHVILRSRLRF